MTDTEREAHAWRIVYEAGPRWHNEYIRRFPNSKAPEQTKREEMAHYCVMDALLLLDEARGEIAQLKSTLRAGMIVELIEEMGRLRNEIACLRRTLVPTPPDSPSPLVSDATMFDEVRNPIR